MIRAGWDLQTDWFANLQACPEMDVQLGGPGFTPQQRFLTGGTHERADGASWRRPGRRSPNGNGLYIRVAAVLGAQRRGSGIVCPHCGARSRRRPRRP